MHLSIVRPRHWWWRQARQLGGHGSVSPQMAEPRKSRKNPRAHVTLVARYRSPTAFEFVKEQCFDLSAGGMFIKSPAPAPAGTLIKLECDLDGGSGTIRGVARVVWLRELETDDQPAGMGVKFVKLEAGGREAIQAILKQLGAAERADGQSSAPPPRSSSARPAEAPLPAPFAKTPSAAPKDEAQAQATEAQPALQAAGSAGATEQTAATLAHDGDQAELPEPKAHAARPDARELRERLRQAKPPRAASGGPAHAPERPTPLEMPRPAEVAAAIARATGASQAAEGPAAAARERREPERKPSASVADAKPAPAAPRALPAPPAAQPNAPRASRSSRRLPLVIAALVVLAAAFLALRPKPPHARLPQQAGPPPQAAALAPRAPPEPAAPPTYAIEVATAPEGARVTLGDKSLVAPGTFELATLDGPVELKAEKDGFEQATATIDRVGFMLDDGVMRRRVVLALSETPQPAPVEPVEAKKAEPAPEAEAKAAPHKPAASSPPEVARASKPSSHEPRAQAESAKPEPATKTAQTTRSEPQPKPAAVPAAAQAPLQAATACLSTGDNPCVVAALEGKAKTPQELELLIETYRAMGKNEQAEKHMQVYVAKFPTGRRANGYRRMLERRQGEAAPSLAQP